MAGRWITALLGIWVTFFLACGFGCAGVALLGGLTPYFDRERARVERLQPLSAAELAGSPPGREVLIEGRISRSNQARFREFVAYRQDVYNGRRCEDNNRTCLEFERLVAPPLLLEVPDGRVQLANEGYALRRPTVHWHDYDYTPRRDPTTGEPSRSYRGLAVGDVVVVVGTVAATGGGPAIAAEWVAGGTRAEYLASVREPAADVFRFGVMSIGVTILMAGLCVRLVWQAVRTHGT
jgi:hypothetical protein